MISTICKLRINDFNCWETVISYLKLISEENFGFMTIYVMFGSTERDCRALEKEEEEEEEEGNH
jgi:hypothetical protein